MNFMKEYENSLHSRGICFIAGVDEAGRGPLAGPVVAAAAVLPFDFFSEGVDDSKKLTAKKREELFERVTKQSLAYGIGIIDNYIIDEINILEATKKAMAEAIEDAARKLLNTNRPAIEHLLLDAIVLKDVLIPQTSIIKGDAKSVSIAAASIAAKVTRDRLMFEYHKIYPCYGFDKNKGYGTKEHYENLAKHGICDIHRKSFLKTFFSKEK